MHVNYACILSFAFVQDALCQDKLIRLRIIYRSRQNVPLDYPRYPEGSLWHRSEISVE